MSRNSWLRKPLGRGLRAHLRSTLDRLLAHAAAAELAGDPNEALRCLRHALRAERELARLDTRTLPVGKTR